MIIDRSKQQKNLLEMLQEKNEYISAPCNGNGICGKCIVRYKSGATEPTKQDREFLSEKQLEQGYRLACQSYPTEEYKVEIPELEETIEVLSQWENQRTEEILKNTAEGTAEKTENAIYGICIDIGGIDFGRLVRNPTKRTGRWQSWSIIREPTVQTNGKQKQTQMGDAALHPEDFTEADAQTVKLGSIQEKRGIQKMQFMESHRSDNDSGGTACESGNRKLPDCCFR